MAISKIGYKFDPFEATGIEIKDRRLREEALEEVAEFINLEVLNNCGDGKTSVKGGAWQRRLSPAYKMKKEEISGVSYSNMELYGDMLDALETVPVNSRQVETRIVGPEAAKADGHNNHSGNSTLPPRQFIPDDDAGQTWRQDILSGVRQILRRYQQDEE